LTSTLQLYNARVFTLPQVLRSQLEFFIKTVLTMTSVNSESLASIVDALSLSQDSEESSSSTSFSDGTTGTDTLKHLLRELSLSMDDTLSSGSEVTSHMETNRQEEVMEGEEEERAKDAEVDSFEDDITSISSFAPSEVIKSEAVVILPPQFGKETVLNKKTTIAATSPATPQPVAKSSIMPSIVNFWRCVCDNPAEEENVVSLSEVLQDQQQDGTPIAVKRNEEQISGHDQEKDKTQEQPAASVTSQSRSISATSQTSSSSYVTNSEPRTSVSSKFNSESCVTENENTQSILTSHVTENNDTLTTTLSKYKHGKLSSEEDITKSLASLQLVSPTNYNGAAPETEKTDMISDASNNDAISYEDASDTSTSPGVCDEVSNSDPAFSSVLTSSGSNYETKDEQHPEVDRVQNILTAASQEVDHNDFNDDDDDAMSASEGKGGHECLQNDQDREINNGACMNMNPYKDSKVDSPTKNGQPRSVSDRVIQSVRTSTSWVKPPSSDDIRKVKSLEYYTIHNSVLADKEMSFTIVGLDKRSEPKAVSDADRPLMQESQPLPAKGSKMSATPMGRLKKTIKGLTKSKKGEQRNGQSEDHSSFLFSAGHPRTRKRKQSKHNIFRSLAKYYKGQSTGLPVIEEDSEQEKSLFSSQQADNEHTEQSVFLNKSCLTEPHPVIIELTESEEEALSGYQNTFVDDPSFDVVAREEREAVREAVLHNENISGKASENTYSNQDTFADDPSFDVVTREEREAVSEPVLHNGNISGKASENRDSNQDTFVDDPSFDVVTRGEREAVKEALLNNENVLGEVSGNIAINVASKNNVRSATNVASLAPIKSEHKSSNGNDTKKVTEKDKESVFSSQTSLGPCKVSFSKSLNYQSEDVLERVEGMELTLALSGAARESPLLKSLDVKDANANQLSVDIEALNRGNEKEKKLDKATSSNISKTKNSSFKIKGIFSGIKNMTTGPFRGNTKESMVPTSQAVTDISREVIASTNATPSGPTHVNQGLIASTSTTSSGRISDKDILTKVMNTWIENEINEGPRSLAVRDKASDTKQDSRDCVESNEFEYTLTTDERDRPQVPHSFQEPLVNLQSWRSVNAKIDSTLKRAQDLARHYDETREMLSTSESYSSSASTGEVSSMATSYDLSEAVSVDVPKFGDWNNVNRKIDDSLSKIERLAYRFGLDKNNENSSASSVL